MDDPKQLILRQIKNQTDLNNQLERSAEEVLRKAEDQYIADGGDPRTLIYMREIHMIRRALSPSRIVHKLFPIEPLPQGAAAIYDKDVADLVEPKDKT